MPHALGPVLCACMHAYKYKFTESQGRAGRAPATTYIAHKTDAGGWVVSGAKVRMHAT